MAQTDFSTAELAKAMDTATDDVKREVSVLIDRAAHMMVGILQQRFPVGPTGNLRRQVRVTSPRAYATTSTGQALQARLVKASAPHVHIWQEGTRERFDATRANARRGKMPKGGRVFEKSAVDSRAEMLRAAQSLLDRNRNI